MFKVYTQTAKGICKMIFSGEGVAGKGHTPIPRKLDKASDP